MSQDYCITVTLLPKLYKLKAEQQYDELYYLYCKILDDLGSHTTIVELTEQCNVHFHSILSFHTTCMESKQSCKKQFYDSFKLYNKFFGRSQLEPVLDYSKWTDYLMKDIEETKKDLGRPPILKDDYDLFNKRKLYLLFHNYYSIDTMVFEAAASAGGTKVHRLEI